MLAVDGVEETPDDPPTPRDRTVRRLLVGALALVVVTAGGVAWQTGHDGSAPGRHVLAAIPTRGFPTWIAELDTGHVTGVIGTRSTIAVLELVTNDLVGLSAASGTERWRVHAAPSHSIAQLEEVDGAAIVLVEESTGDRSIAAYDLESGERMWREDGLDRAAFVAFQGSIYRLPDGVTDVAIQRLDPQTGEGLNAVSSQLWRASAGRTRRRSATTSSRSSTCRLSNASAVRSPSATWSRPLRTAIGWWVSDGMR